MASDPDRGQDPEASLFDRTRYTGDFGDYSRMHAYYASSGGRKNTSVRMRRYPHQNKAGKGITHIALTAQDGNRKFLLTAGEWHTVQLVAFDDIIQYFFDGQLVYEMRAGDRVRIERNKKETQGSIRREAISAVHARVLRVPVDEHPSPAQGLCGVPAGCEVTCWGGGGVFAVSRQESRRARRTRRTQRRHWGGVCWVVLCRADARQRQFLTTHIHSFPLIQRE